MDPAVRRSYDAARDLTRNRIPAACYAPFVSMYFTTTGHVVACCKSQSLSVGNVAEERLDDIWNGKRLETFRKMVAAYALPAECGLCSWQIQAGDYGGVFARLFDLYGVESARPQWPRVMEFSTSNECNLECVMCTGESSSRIRARREKLPALPDVYGDQFYTDLRKYLPHLHLAKFLGGEPFLIRGNYRIWDMMIEDGLKTPCIITTNGTWLDARVERVLESLPVSIVISLDGATKETVEAVRLGAKFEVLMEHTRRFIDTTRRRGTSFNFMYSIVRRNWSEFPDFLLLAESLGVESYVSTVVYPPQHSIYTWPPEKMREVVATLEARDAELSRRLKLNLPIWRSILSGLQKNATEAQTKTALSLSGEIPVEEMFGGAESLDLLARANRVAGEGRREEAIETALKATPRDVHYYQALALAGRLLRDLGRHEESVRVLDRAIAAAPARAEAYVERGWSRYSQSQLADAVADAEKAGELLRGTSDPDLEHSQCGLAATVYARAGRTGDARAAIERLFELRPDDALSYARRGWSWFAATRYDDALADARAALARDPGLVTATELERVASASVAAAAQAAAVVAAPDAPPMPRLCERLAGARVLTAAEEARVRAQALAALGGAGVLELLTDRDDVIREIVARGEGLLARDTALVGRRLDDLRLQLAGALGRNWQISEGESSGDRVDWTIRAGDDSHAPSLIRTILLPRFDPAGGLIGLRVLLARPTAVSIS